MSFLGQGANAGIPGDADPFDMTLASAEYAAAQSFPPPEGHRHFAAPPPSGEANTLATLSVVFAFVLAPAGAVLGHLALSQIKHRPQPGRRRAILGLTFSYVLIVLAVVTLLVWLLLGAGRQTDAASTTDTLTPSATPSVRSTVITPPAQGRLRVSVADLRVGDCVEIQKNEPVPQGALTKSTFTGRIVWLAMGFSWCAKLCRMASIAPPENTSPMNKKPYALAS